MSGICGFFNRDGRPAEAASIGRMAAAVARHGPDGTATRIDGPFGCARLLRRSVPEDAFDSQPLVGAGGRLTLVADARIDNRDELGRALEIEDAEARRLADADFILKAWERWGQDCLGRLVGNFALALWDARERELVCAVDSMASRGLFVHAAPRLFAFAPAPRGLHALSEIPRRLNEAKLVDALAVFPSDVEATYFEAVFRLRPGELRTVSASGDRRQRFWSVPRDTLRLKGDGEYAELARALLDEAVRCRLRSPKPVGAMLSGGLDSSGVACLAARQLQAASRRLQTFTHVPLAGFQARLGPGRFGDESALVERIREHQPGLEVLYVRSEEQLLFEGLDAQHEAGEAPVLSPFNNLWFEDIVRLAAQEGLGVLLTGQRGNQTLSWHGRSPPVAAPRRALLRLGLGSWLSRPDPGHALLRRSYLRPEPIEAFRVVERLGAAALEREVLVAEDYRLARADAFLTGGANHGVNRWAPLFGIELRDPTADRRLVEFCLRTPPDQYKRGEVDRWLMRRAMQGVLPPAVLENRRRGRQAADWLERLAAAPALPKILDALQRSSRMARLIDVPRLVQDATRLQASAVDAALQTRLGRALGVALFSDWFDAASTGGDRG